MDKYIIGFWNYTECESLNVEQSVGDWNELGLNFALTSICREEEDKKYILQTLDECNKKGIKVIVCDSKLDYHSLIKNGRQKYEKDILEDVKAFGHHPAFYAFLVGDEPHGYEWEDMKDALKLVNKHTRAYINFLPIVENNRQHKSGVSVSKKRYSDLLAKTVKETGLDLLSYDCYTQCNIHRSERGIDNYFENLNCYRKASLAAGVPFITTLLSVGHWNYRVPTEDDIRWQVSTAIAHGAKGFFWFFIYERSIDSSYRLAPIDFMNRKTKTYDFLKRQNHVFTQQNMQYLFDTELIDVYHVKKAYGGTKKYKKGIIRGFQIKTVYNNPLIVSRFAKKDKIIYVIVNNSQSDIENVIVDIDKKRYKEWLAPGQMVILPNG